MKKIIKRLEEILISVIAFMILPYVIVAKVYIGIFDFITSIIWCIIASIANGIVSVDKTIHSKK